MVNPNDNSKASSIMKRYNDKCSTITILMVAAILITLLHVFVPFLEGPLFATICILLLISAAGYTGIAGVGLFNDIKNHIGEADSVMRKGLERNASLNCLLAAVLTGVVVVVLFRTLQ